MFCFEKTFCYRFFETKLISSLKLFTSLSKLFIILLTIVTLPTYIIAVTDNESTIKPCEKWNSEELVNKEINEDGSITSNGITYRKNEIYKEDNVSRGCMCLRSPCIRKCCPLDQVYKFYEGENGNITKCVNESVVNFLSELKYYEFTPRSIPKESNNTNNISVVNEELQPYCPGRKIKIDKSNFILTNGSLVIQDDTKEGYEFKNINEYCADMIGDTVYYFTCLKTDITNTTVDIFYDITVKIVRMIEMITLVFLIITFLVSYFFPDLHNLVGKSLCCLTFSKIINYIIYLLLHMNAFVLGDLLCVPIAYIYSYCIMATYFWLNVMCFDIWQAFRENRPQRSIKKDEKTNRLRKRYLYGWGMPAVLCLTMYIADQCLPNTSRFKPMMGFHYCAISFENKSVTVFHVLPIVILLIINGAMFFTTVFKIDLHKKQTEKLKTKGKSNSDQNFRERIMLFFKLFLLMGIAMIADPLPLLINLRSKWSLLLAEISLPLMDTTLFVIFVCKRRTLEKISTKLRPSKNNFISGSSTNFDQNKTEITIATIES